MKAGETPAAQPIQLLHPRRRYAVWRQKETIHPKSSEVNENSVMEGVVSALMWARCCHIPAQMQAARPCSCVLLLRNPRYVSCTGWAGSTPQQPTGTGSSLLCSRSIWASRSQAWIIPTNDTEELTQHMSGSRWQTGTEDLCHHPSQDEKNRGLLSPRPLSCHLLLSSCYEDSPSNLFHANPSHALLHPSGSRSKLSPSFNTSS